MYLPAETYHLGLTASRNRSDSQMKNPVGPPNFSRQNKHFFDGGRFSPVCTYTYIGSRGAGHRRGPRAPGCQCKGGRGFSKRAEDFASGRHFCGVSSADFGAGIGLYVSETDTIGTFLAPNPQLKISVRPVPRPSCTGQAWGTSQQPSSFPSRIPRAPWRPADLLAPML